MAEEESRDPDPLTRISTAFAVQVQGPSNHLCKNLAIVIRAMEVAGVGRPKREGVKLPGVREHVMYEWYKDMFQRDFSLDPYGVHCIKQGVLNCNCGLVRIAGGAPGRRLFRVREFDPRPAKKPEQPRPPKRGKKRGWRRGVTSVEVEWATLSARQPSPRRSEGQGGGQVWEEVSSASSAAE